MIQRYDTELKSISILKFDMQKFLYTNKAKIILYNVSVGLSVVFVDHNPWFTLTNPILSDLVNVSEQ